MNCDKNSFLAGLRTGLALGRRVFVSLIAKLIRANGIYRAENDGAAGYSVVTVDVPNSYTQADEGKVVVSGALAAQTALTVTANGIYNTTENNSVTVNVSGGGTAILSGGPEPTAAQGVDGSLYLQTWPPFSVPAGVTPLDYIESSGTQWIDTGVPARTFLRCEIDVQCMQNSGDPQILGATGGASSAVYLGYNWNSSYYSIYCNWGGWRDTRGVDNDRHLFIANAESGNNYQSRDGVKLWSDSATVSSTTSSEHLNIFRRSNGTRYASARLYGLKIYDLLNSGALLRDFRPVLDGNGVACLYDTVTGTYFHNAGSGSFTPGAAVRTGEIVAAFVKKNGAWINLIGANISDVG